MYKILFSAAVSALFLMSVQAQTAFTDKISTHFQLTSIMQGHPAFSASNIGQNSLSSNKQQALSLTSTLFLGTKLWKGASIYFNPEVAGGRGIGSALGIAGFTNGECFRIGNPEPALYVARAYFKQHIALSPEMVKAVDAANQVAEDLPIKRITITAGKFSIADIFDNNGYSHDPRGQFMNWSLMSNGAWDYAANTRGYTYGTAIEYISSKYAARVAGTLVPLVANGPDMDWNISKVNSLTLELQRNFEINGKPLIIRALVFNNTSRAGNYKNVVAQFKQTGDSAKLEVNKLVAYNSAVKYGYGLNIEQQLSDNIGWFGRASWNDGQTATWAFTEIDESYSVGTNIKGAFWKRLSDELGIAVVANGISAAHRSFLNVGGYGFIIGDGKLPNYKREIIEEVYYKFKYSKNLYFTADYQHVQNPAYNPHNGPVNVWALRGHVEF